MGSCMENGKDGSLRVLDDGHATGVRCVEWRREHRPSEGRSLLRAGIGIGDRYVGKPMGRHAFEMRSSHLVQPRDILAANLYQGICGFGSHGHVLSLPEE